MIRRNRFSHRLFLIGIMALIGRPVLAAPGLRFVQTLAFSDERTRCRCVVAPRDTSGRPIQGLTAAHFQARVDGQPAPIRILRRTRADAQPLAVILALDISKSMAKGDGMNAARGAASAFVERLEPEDRVCLLTFGNVVARRTAFTGDRGEMRQQLSRVTATDDRTHLYQALFDAAGQSDLLPTGKAVVVALTDGKDEGSAVTLEDAARAAREEGVAVYALGFGPQADHKALQRIVDLTGGRYLYAPSADVLPALYARIWEQLKDGYALEIETPVLLAGPHTLDVTLAYRGQSAAAHRDFEMPAPPIPLWIRRSVSAVGVTTLLLTLWGLVRTRAGRKQAEAPAPMLPQVWLEIAAGPQRGRRARLPGRPFRIGRGEECDLTLTHDRRTAPCHAELRQEGNGTFAMVNCARPNDTLLNGNPVGTGQSVRLRNGDRLMIGETECVFVDGRTRR